MIFLYSVCSKTDRKSPKGHSFVVFFCYLQASDFAKKQGVTKNFIEQLFQACILPQSKVEGAHFLHLTDLVH